MILGVIASSKSFASVLINGYVASSSPDFCSKVTSTTQIYTSQYNLIINAYNNAASIYSNSSLTTLAPSGYYGDSKGGAGQTNYYWSGTAWTTSNKCK